MKTIDKKGIDFLRFDNKKEIREKLESFRPGQWLYAIRIYRGIDNIGKTKDGKFCTFAYGSGFFDGDVTIISIEEAVDIVWKHNGHIFDSVLEKEV